MKAVPIGNDKLEIIHEYCYREPVEETYEPEKSNYNFGIQLKEQPRKEY